ncbi:MAG: hypothetical protein IT446_07255 [Phycisphaerales bacterium]|nr:hypothetical protein [Phycisphaerales bacterium]
MKRSMMWMMGVVAGMLMVGAGCATAPTSPQERQALQQEAGAAVRDMKTASPTINDILSNGYAYAIFPSVGKGGMVVGGAYGRGVVYQGGNLIGYSDLSQASIGLQLGGQTYSELIVFQNADALNKFKQGNYAFAADASAVALKSGASVAADYRNGVAVFTNPLGGAMFQATVGGQEFTFVAADQVQGN